MVEHEEPGAFALIVRELPWLQVAFVTGIVVLHLCVVTYLRGSEFADRQPRAVWRDDG